MSSLREVELVASEKKKWGSLVPSLLLMILTHSIQKTGIIKLVTILRYRLPNLRRVEVSQFLCVLLIGSTVVLIRGIMRKEGISALCVFRQTTILRIVRLVKLL